MKCSHKGDFIITLLIILIANDEWKAFALFLNEKSFGKNSVNFGIFPASKNTLHDNDLFPNMESSDSKHRIVKKQMGVSDEREFLRKNIKNLVDEGKSFSIDRSTKDNYVNVGSGFNSWTLQSLEKAFNEHETPITNNKQERFIRPPKEFIEEEKENQNKLKGTNRNDYRLKRDLIMCKKKKIDIPEPNPDGECEPSNEWTDASQDKTQNIPAEFKPKPKKELRIFHLKCKRESTNRNLESLVGKRQTWNRFMCLDAGRRAFHPAKAYPTRVHPRSFLIRIKKRREKNIHQRTSEKEPERQERDDDEDDEEDSDEDEEDYQDDEDDDEDAEYEDNDKDNVSITQKPDRKESIKEFFRTAKEAVINRAKFEDGFVAGSFKSESGKESLVPSKNEKEESFSEKSKRVLIDANIKLDGAISHALKGILGHRKQKNVEQKENKDMFVGDNEVVDNEKKSNEESQLTALDKYLLGNNLRKKRHLLSLFVKKNRDVTCSEKGGLVSVDSLINGINSEFDREELLQKLQQIRFKDSKLNKYD